MLKCEYIIVVRDISRDIIISEKVERVKYPIFEKQPTPHMTLCGEEAENFWILEKEDLVCRCSKHNDYVNAGHHSYEFLRPITKAEAEIFDILMQ